MKSNEENRGLVQVHEPTSSTEIIQTAQAVQAIQQLGQAMQGVAEMVRATNERMTMLERQVALLTKVTAAQAKEIGAEIRERARALAEAHGLPGREISIANAIRKAVRVDAGVGSVRELPRCEYKVYLEMVRIWDDYRVVKEIKRKARENQ